MSVLLPIRPDDPGFMEGLIEDDPSYRDLVERARRRPSWPRFLNRNGP